MIKPNTILCKFFDEMGEKASILVLKNDSLLYLMFASMANLSLSVLSVAPDDFSNECIRHADPGTVNNPNEKVLLDTQFYHSQSLLTVLGEDNLWINLDLDDRSSASSTITVRSMHVYTEVRNIYRDEGSEVCCLYLT